MQKSLEFEMTATPEIGSSLPPLPELSRIESLGFDTETTVERDLFDRSLVGISYYLPDGTKGYIPFRHPGGGNYPLEQVQRWAKHELRNKQLVVANAKHEVHTMNMFGVNLEEQGCRMRDVFHQAALLDDRRFQINMDLLVKQEFGINRIEANHAEIYLMPANLASSIAIEDAELAWKLNEVYSPRIADEDLGRVLKLEDDLVYATCEMERNGAYLDIPTLLRWRTEVQSEWEKRVLQIFQDTGMRIDPGSWKDMERLFNKLKLTFPRTEATDAHPDGCPSFPEEFLMTVEDPVARLALEARQLASLKNKFLDGYLDKINKHGLLRYSLHQVRGEKGTVTGRYSSSADKNGIGVNIQQVSKKSKQPLLLQRWPIRQLFIPPPGRVWVSADAYQIEFRLFAHYAAVALHRSRLARAYQENPSTDFHDMIVNWTGLSRPFAKNVNFCKLYGGGADKVATMCGVDVKKGQEIVDDYDREFPEAKLLIRKVAEKVRKVGFAKTILGRRSRFEIMPTEWEWKNQMGVTRTEEEILEFKLKEDKQRYYMGLNRVQQGTAADIMKIKLLETYRQRKALDLTMRFPVHDEIDGDIASKEALHPFQELLNAQSIEMEVPILWEAGTGASWHEAQE